MTDHKGLPVSGYVPQKEKNIARVNLNKILEEQCIRAAEEIQKTGGYDARMAALAITNIQQGFMWLNRAVFQPERIKLPENTK